MTGETDLVVVGAGIAGLVVALEAATAGARVTVLESDDRVGGMLRRGRIAGVDVDLGAESFAKRTDAVPRLIADFALPLEVVVPNSGPAHLVSQPGVGRWSRLPLPRRTVIGIPADPLAADVVAIIGERAARRAAVEVLDAPVDPTASLADVVEERLGAGLVRDLVDPLCRSIYSQPAAAVPLPRLHPKMWAAFERTGSLLAAAGEVAPHAAGGTAVGGIMGGMWRLADAVASLAQERGAVIRTGVVAEALSSDAAGVSVVLADGESIRAARAVVATGPRGAAALLGAPASEIDEAATAPIQPAVRLLTAAVTAPDLAADPVGSGVIVAPGAHTAAKALTHIDAKWAWARAALPEGTHLVRLSARVDDSAGLDSATAVAREIAHLTGGRVDRDDIGEIVTTRWRDAVVPAESEAWTETVADAAARGIHVVGAVAAGTGLASVIPHARALAHELLAPTSVRKESR
ncbi:NAD(P)/FAD-dependent oxidoreductase [Microbacterium sp. cf332]|uniref:protoporphyrinogen/coproporphyrinogen oxidase n=1 Tax=Microbacterium sp. cf332 TaxID=1761804 RepID=UPI00088A3EAF|nr:FAD-dependent oxidoreductase [Microbacterium sp. cf332]SDQ04993.1 oxygen-dependent protoporphyrinogen oxidase [Microbacterium sp. cf332]